MACVIEVRDQELYVFVGSNSRRSIKAKKFFRIYLSEPLFVNNEVVFNDSLVNQVRAILNKNGVKEKRVDVVINHRVTLTKDLVLPKTDRKKLSFMVSNEMTSVFNLTKEFVVDYRVLGTTDDEGVSKYRVLASAIRKQTVFGLELFFGDLGMKIKSMQPATSSFLQLVGGLDLLDTMDPMIIVDASRSYIRYYLFNKAEFILLRSQYIGVDDASEFVSQRVVQILELLIQSQFGITGKAIRRVQLVGFDKRFGMLSGLIEKNMGIVPSPVDLSRFLNTADSEILDFVNSMGVLL